MSSSKPVLEAERAPAQVSQRSLLWKWAIPIGVGLLLWICPAPADLTANAWRFFALFAMVAATLVAEPLPSPAVGFIGVSAATVLILVGNTPTEAMRWALSGFSNDTVWLIMAAAMFALGYEKTGLGRRIALVLVKALGKRTLGLGYAIALSDLILAPFMPSATARSGGTIYSCAKTVARGKVIHNRKRFAQPGGMSWQFTNSFWKRRSSNW